MSRKVVCTFSAIRQEESSMIAQVLHRDTVLAHSADVGEALAEQAAPDRRADPLPASLRGTSSELDALTPEDFQTARDLLAESLRAERAESSGQPSFPPPLAERRNEESAPLDDFAFFSRDAVLSNLQSALESYYAEAAGNELTTPAAPSGDDRRGGFGLNAGDTDVAVTEVAVASVGERRDFDGRRVFDQFSVTDPRWVSSVFAMGVRRFRHRFPFVDRPAPERALASDARVILVGDWGSGLPRAIKVAVAIRRDLDDEPERERHVIHLGDVYYSGWSYEYERRFLAHWPVRADEKDLIRSWNLNGNHDMYAGGHAYYQVALADPRFAKYHQGSSWFRLVNDDWQLFGLDTAHEEHGLAGSQGQWVLDHLTAAPNSKRKNLLLSHHQIFSAYEDCGKNAGGHKSELRSKIAPTLATGRVTSWFWGHEHRCALYRQGEDGVGFARCLGHGGVPVYMSREPDAPVAEPATYEFRRAFWKGLEHWARFGYAVLDFEGPAIEVSYRDENGEEDHRERIA
jgi:Calcineurin-like phosphoesterase